MIHFEMQKFLEIMGPVIILTALVIVMLIIASVLDWFREQRASPEHGDVPSWDDIADAIDAGLCVTEDVLPMGPMPEFLATPHSANWWDAYIRDIAREVVAK